MRDIKLIFSGYRGYLSVKPLCIKAFKVTTDKKIVVTLWLPLVTFTQFWPEVTTELEMVTTNNQSSGYLYHVDLKHLIGKVTTVTTVTTAFLLIYTSWFGFSLWLSLPWCKVEPQNSHTPFGFFTVSPFGV